jgi:hypothetical protein
MLGEALGPTLGAELGFVVGSRLGGELGLVLGAPLGHNVQMAVMLRSAIPYSAEARNPVVRCPVAPYQPGGMTMLTRLTFSLSLSPTTDIQTSPRNPSFAAST